MDVLMGKGLEVGICGVQEVSTYVTELLRKRNVGGVDDNGGSLLYVAACMNDVALNSQRYNDSPPYRARVKKVFVSVWTKVGPDLVSFVNVFFSSER